MTEKNEQKIKKTKLKRGVFLFFCFVILIQVLALIFLSRHEIYNYVQPSPKGARIDKDEGLFHVN